MTQTIELPKLRTFDLLSPSEQSAIRRHCQNVVALALRRKYGTVAEHVPDPDVAHVPEPTPRKFTRSQLEMGFSTNREPKADREITPAQQATFYNQLNTHKQRNEPTKPEPKVERKLTKGERRTWTPGGKQKPQKSAPEPIEREPKRRPEIVRPLKPVEKLSLPARICAALLECGPMTNAELSEKIGFGSSPEGVKRCQVLTLQMRHRSEIEIVGTRPKFGSIPANLYMVVREKPVRVAAKVGPKVGVKGENLLRVAEWLKTDGPKTIDQMAEFLGADVKFVRSVIERLRRYGMAHQDGHVINEKTNRPLYLYAAGPEPIRSRSK